MALGDPLDQSTINQYMQQANNKQFDWGGLGYSGWNDKGDAIVKAYMSNFNRLPTQQEFDLAAPQFAGPNGNAYVASLAQQQQAQQQAPQKEADLLNQLSPTISNLVNQQTANATKQFTDPNSATYQNFSGNMNNLGITPQSGAFQEGLGSTLGQNSANFINSALGSTALPTISGFQQGQMQPWQQSMQQPYDLQQQGYDWQQFMAQQQLAQQLAKQGAPSGAQNMLGMASGAAQGAGGLASGIGQGFGKNGTWVCTELRRRELMTRFQVDALHEHLFKAFWIHPMKFLGYFAFGKFVVWMANVAGIDWTDWRNAFYDDVLLEQDPAKAVDRYESAFWALCREVWHKLLIKMLILYDNPMDQR